MSVAATCPRAVMALASAHEQVPRRRRRWSSSSSSLHYHHPIFLRPHYYFARKRHAVVTAAAEKEEEMPHGHRDSLFSDTSSSTNEADNRRPEPPPLIHTLFEELTETWQYVVADPITRHAVIIDPHLDNAPSSTSVSTIAADRVIAVVAQNRYYVDRILHTHESQHHGSSAWYIRAQLLERTGVAPRVTVGRTMAAVQRVFKRKYSMNDGTAWKPDFDNGFSDGQEFHIGAIKATALHFRNGTLAFVIGQHVFAGTSMIELELRNRNGGGGSSNNHHKSFLGDLRNYRIYTSHDAPPQRKARLVPIYEGSKSRSRSQTNGRKLVIKYAAENEEIAELEG
ncbi:hypothetical protein AC578_10516 [Pseudocercospora eumusae]|uniref:Metallo-beta-lactamase domain-containing protein n=1 Tax=Pseudocercospora eumusae TaxID=321146 RepID=A0A139GV73_9PEZI|nr:hypothetical protein AC578_10516 [Pseudocercospora eumusae]